MNSVVKIAIGILKCGDEVLLAQRKKNQTFADKWEFPGGKIKASETPEQALIREFKEEVGIATLNWLPLITVPWQYEINAGETLSLQLHALLLEVFDKPTESDFGAEGQKLKWQKIADLQAEDFPEANKGIIEAITLPDAMMISGGFDNAYDALSRLQAALEDGVKLVQFRAKKMDKSEFMPLAKQATQLCHQFGAKILINGKPEWLEELPDADGLQLSSHAIEEVAERPIAQNKLLSVSTHSDVDIAKALELKADIILISPVKETSAHPDMDGLGWASLAEMIESIPVPVYALGGMKLEDIEMAKQQGAQGIAAISGFWPRKF